MLKNFFIFLLLSTISVFSVHSQNGIPEKTNRLVNNFSNEFPNFLSSQEEELLEQKLENFSDQTSNQIVIVITDDLAGYEPWEFATNIINYWGVGQTKEDNGIVILIKPTKSNGGRQEFIAIGRGLEGAIPDAVCRQIEERELLSNLKNGDFFKALDQTTDALMGIAKGEINTKEYSKKNKNSGKSLLKIIVIVIIIIIFIITRFRDGGRGGFTMGSSGIFFGGGGFGGGGFGGGSSGGGFGGFGGGSSGGGGSGGSW